MGKIFMIMGRSSSGKSTVLSAIKDMNPKVKVLLQRTSRPIRSGECNGVDYIFVNTDMALSSKGKSIYFEELSVTSGVWYYYYMPVILGKDDYYICIGRPKAYEAFLEYYGKDSVIPILLKADEGIVLTRSIARECLSDKPDFKELCRRFLLDSVDYNIDYVPEENTFYNNFDEESCINSVNMLINKYLI